MDPYEVEEDGIQPTWGESFESKQVHMRPTFVIKTHDPMLWHLSFRWRKIRPGIVFHSRGRIYTNVVIVNYLSIVRKLDFYFYFLLHCTLETPTHLYLLAHLSSLPLLARLQVGGLRFLSFYLPCTSLRPKDSKRSTFSYFSLQALFYFKSVVYSYDDSSKACYYNKILVPCMLLRNTKYYV